MTSKTENNNHNDIFVVGIGASAGGLDALQEFFKHIPLNTGMAFCIIQHLSPNFKSLMSDLLGKYSKMPISTVEDGEEIKANHIYLNPNNASLKISNKAFKYVPKNDGPVLNLPIDTFFHSLGKEYKDKAIGVILSGTGTDGSRGIKTLKEVSGTIMVQNPKSAQFDGMPNTAIGTGLAEYIGTPAELALEIVKFPSKPSFVNAVNGGSITEIENTFNDILDVLYKFSGQNFKDYKHNTLVRRLEKRMGSLNIQEILEYLNLLKVDDDEKLLLINDFYIGVTSFFRDTEAWNVLKTEILPLIFDSKKHFETVRVWSAGCSTGEEAYSLAIIMDEYIRENKLATDFKVFATDADLRALEVASNGEYILNMANEIPSKYIEKYFTRIGNYYQVNKKIREKIVFSRHDVLNDPPFIKMDLISCRNLLIYLSVKSQYQVLEKFKFSLLANSYLFLGSSETLGDLQKDFSVLNAKHKMYQVNGKKKLSNYFTFDNNAYKHIVTGKRTDKQLHVSSLLSPIKRDNESLFTNHLLNEFVPKSVFIDKDYNILFVKGDLKSILKISEGIAQYNLLKMIDEKLAVMVRNGVKRVKQENKNIVFNNVKNSSSETTSLINLSFSRVKSDNDSEIYLIVFEDNLDLKEKVTEAIVYNQYKLDEFSKQRIDDLEFEIKAKNAELQYVIEELETSNEELQASNEELMASNEELQGTNEELQSVNEELYTVNSELQFKNKELAVVNDDMLNFFISTEIGTLFLDNKLNIRKVTPNIKKHFDIEESDAGRYIGSFSHRLTSTNEKAFIKDLKEVLKTGVKLERKIFDKEGVTYLNRIIPYRDREQNIDGVVITYVDITNLIQTENKLIKANEERENLLKQLELIMNNIPAMIFYKDNKNNLLKANNYLANLLGKTKYEIEGKNLLELIDPFVAKQHFDDDLEVINTGKSKTNILESYDTKNGKAWFTTNKILLKNKEDNNILGVSIDITELELARKELINVIEKLKTRNDELAQFAYVTSHDLQEPLNTIIGFIELLKSENEAVYNEDSKQYIKIVLDATERMKTLIKGILEYSRIGKNKILTTFKTNDLLTEIIEDLNSVIKEKNAKIEILDLPLTITGYKNSLRTLFQNLISNAIKFSKVNESPIVIISGKETPKYLKFSIKDNGIGIEKKHVVKIFEIFKRLHTNKQYQGTGIGLAKCKKTAELHGGSIHVKSKLGEGSEFIITLSKNIKDDE
ncbi:CheR family methyltransferase [Mariniflexile jejuense]|uniref:CheR family methyltransferase n=1 Tax=Mariniflexile jejuense TaxID=1173582 RepID=A0ABW3JP39_9FLAO